MGHFHAQEMRVGFYTCGNNLLGLGHVYRCVRLAKALEWAWPGAQIRFEAKVFPEGLAVIRDYYPSAINPLPGDSLPGGPWEVLVVDQLSVPVDALRNLKSHCKLLVVFDDTGPGHFAADLGINALYQCRIPRPADSSTRTLSGVEYLVIDPGFSAQSYRVREPVQHVLLTQGGADTYGLIPQIALALRSWMEHNTEVTLHILIGRAFAHHQELESAIAAMPGRVEAHCGIANLAEFFSQMDLAISAAGVTACELVCLGVPTILITGEEKELETSDLLGSRRCVVNLGIFNEQSRSELPSVMTRMLPCSERQGFSARAREAIDGKGLSRCVSEIVNATRPIRTSQSWLAGQSVSRDQAS